jgi:EAL and modified HD-GYP domain-containing signal transduction protein
VHESDGSLFGYELLFRDPSGADAGALGDDATTATILAAFADFPPGELLGGRRGFVNLTRAFLIGELPVPFEPHEVILEVFASSVVDDALVAGIQALSDAGYLITLDDYSLTGPTAALLPLAHIMKVDVVKRPWAEVVQLAERARELGVRALAERVETQKTAQYCHAAGYTLFQGYFFSGPTTLTTPTIDTGRISALRLLALLADPAVSVSSLEEALRSDPGLTYRLLKATNSAASGLAREVSSIRDAIVVVGLAKLRAWAALLAFSGSPTVEMAEALTRARACELLAEELRTERPEVAFTVGLLDGLMDSLGMSAEEFLAQMPPLGAALSGALIGEAGPLAEILSTVTNYQDRGSDPADSRSDPRSAQLDDAVSVAYLSAWAWATRTSTAFDPN